MLLAGTETTNIPICMLALMELFILKTVEEAKKKDLLILSASIKPDKGVKL